MTEPRTCGYTVLDLDGNEEPCDRPASGWRWYQDTGHEDVLDAACFLHENEGGRRMVEMQERINQMLERLEQTCGCVYTGDFE